MGLCLVLAQSACTEPQEVRRSAASVEEAAPFACPQRLAGGDTQVELLGGETCFICGHSNLHHIIDDDAQSHGEISVTGPSLSVEDGVGVRVTAQRGVVFPGGTEVKALVSYPSLDIVGSVYLRLLLDGNTVAEGRVAAHVIGGTAGGAPERRQFSMAAEHPYNQVEIILSNTGLGDASAGGDPIYPGAGTAALNIFEICGG